MYLINIAILIMVLLLGFYAYAGEPTDKNIQDAIKSEIYLDEFITSDDIHVFSRNGFVTIFGTVNSEEERKKIIDIATYAAGVSAVDTTNLVVFIPH